MRKALFAAILAGHGLMVLASPSSAAQRVALVVGNGGYTAENIPALANPVNDAKSMARALETSGFEVRLVTDADQAAMKAAIEAFGERLEQSGGDAVGLFYYAGHGVEVRGQKDGAAGLEPMSPFARRTLADTERIESHGKFLHRSEAC